jgi:hypothetical protein
LDAANNNTEKTLLTKMRDIEEISITHTLLKIVDVETYQLAYDVLE